MRKKEQEAELQSINIEELHKGLVRLNATASQIELITNNAKLYNKAIKDANISITFLYRLNNTIFQQIDAVQKAAIKKGIKSTNVSEFIDRIKSSEKR